MKKITLSLILIFTIAVSFAQRTVSISTINGQTLPDFIAATGKVMNIGSSYEFVIDITNQETSGNDLIIKVLTGGFGDTANIASVPITAANGQLTVTLIPTEVVSGAILQVRTTTSVNFGNSGDNVFDYSWTVDPSLSTNEFEKLTSFYPNPVKDVIYFGNDVQTKSYKVLSITGSLIKEIEAVQKSLDVSDLKTGMYFLATDSAVGKFIKL